jgi:hypothetical protein
MRLCSDTLVATRLLWLTLLDGKNPCVDFQAVHIFQLCASECDGDALVQLCAPLLLDTQSSELVFAHACDCVTSCVRQHVSSTKRALVLLKLASDVVSTDQKLETLRVALLAIDSVSDF